MVAEEAAGTTQYCVRAGAVAQVVDRGVKEAGRGRAKIGREVHADKSIRRNGHGCAVGGDGLTGRGGERGPPEHQRSRADRAVGQVHRALHSGRGDALRAGNWGEHQPHQAQCEHESQFEFESQLSASAEPITETSVDHELHARLYLLPGNAARDPSQTSLLLAAFPHRRKTSSRCCALRFRFCVRC